MAARPKALVLPSEEWWARYKQSSLLVRASRLQAFQLEAEANALKLTGQVYSGLEATLKEAYQDAYYRTGFDFAKNFGAAEVTRLDDKLLRAALNETWAGGNFSSRISVLTSTFIHQFMA